MSASHSNFNQAMSQVKIFRFLAVVSVVSVVLVSNTLSQASAAGGFNQYGYNYSARIFSGPADGVDKVLDGKVWGDSMYAADHLVMKWNAAWNACNANGYNDPKYCAGAWVTNAWNGNVPSGSGWSEHIKIIWVGSSAENSSYWIDGGYSVWDNYEVISDRATDPNHVKFIWAFGSPNGLGSSK